MKKLNTLFRLLSARLSGEEQKERQPDVPRYQSGPVAGPEGDTGGRRYVDRGASDAAKKLWCSAQHF